MKWKVLTLDTRVDTIEETSIDAENIEEAIRLLAETKTVVYVVSIFPNDRG
jgi:hypothetical protein